ncbi:protein kinase [Trypanosoma theileri]|uniref:Protein kinase n=1 Tax=Trypanosoma theileri TaxID=67003 RepID=A0A1X0NPS6_9TRYP|nr:protein kinase [Trypanosoma theileri]ORC86601.1 protein kinase [Trypanosoma theileri]
MSNSHMESASVIGSCATDSVLLETRTFCVVCGRFGSDFVLRRSGLKCTGCVGKAANKQWVRLQHRQANELLSQATRARLPSGTLIVPSPIGDHRPWASSSGVDSEELDSIPPDPTNTHTSSSETRTIPPIRPPRSRFASISLTESGGGSSVTHRQSQPHIMDYIAHTACYQAAAAGVRVTDVLSSASNQAGSSTPGTNEDSCMNDTINSLTSPPLSQPKRRKAPAAPPRKSIPHVPQVVGKDSEVEQVETNGNDKKQVEDTVKEDKKEVQDKKEVESKKVNDKENKTTGNATAIDSGKTPTASAQNVQKNSNGRTGGPKNKTKREKLVVPTKLSVLLAEEKEPESNERSTIATATDALPPLLQSDAGSAHPKTPRADELIGLLEGASDVGHKEGSPEAQPSFTPARSYPGENKRGTSTQQQQLPSHTVTVSASTADHHHHQRGASYTSATTAGLNSGLNSLRSSVDAGRSAAPAVFAKSITPSDSGTRNSKRVSATSSVTQRSKGKVHERPRQKQPQQQQQQQQQQQKEQERQQQQQSQPQQSIYVDPANRQFGRSEQTSGGPVVSSPSSGSSSSSSSSSSPSPSCSSLPSSNAEGSRTQEILTDEPTAYHRLSTPMDNAKSPLSVNIDRLYVVVEGPSIMSPDESPSTKGRRCSASSSTSATHALVPVPVPSAPGSKFTVTRYFSTHQRQESCGSLITPRNGYDHRFTGNSSNSTTTGTPNNSTNNYSGVVAGAESTTQRMVSRRRNVVPPEGIEAKKLAFTLIVRDRDTKTDLYSLERRYFVDLAPTFHELKSIMHSLPRPPSRRIPSTRYVTESFIAERREECQVFLDAVVQNHFLVRHPKVVQLLRLEPYLLSGSASKEHPIRSGSSLRNRGDARISVTSLFPAGTASMPVSLQLNDNTLEILRSMSSMSRFDRQISTSSCLSTTSSVSRRGAMDSINREDLERVQLGNLIGRGTFGTVYLGLLPGYSTVVAVKVVRVNENVDEDFLYSMRKELDVLRAARHKNIIRFLGSTYLEHERELRVFTEYVECGNISTMVKKFGSLPMTVIQKYMTQILRGLHYLHSMAIVHRDVKGENILVTKRGRCKLADFGCSGPLHEVEGREEVQGSPLWMAPEVIHGAAPATAADVWAVGCVGIEMLKRPLWNIRGDLNPYIFLYRVGKMNGPPHGLPTEAEVQAFSTSPETQEEFQCFSLYRDFLCQCLRVQPEERWSAAELLRHPFLHKHFSKHLRWTPPPDAGPKEESARTTPTPPNTEAAATPSTATGITPENTTETETTNTTTK